MPRKRKTRNVNQTRPAPTLPDGDEGKDLEKNLHDEKLKVLLHDFDTEVKSRYKTMRNTLDNILQQMQVIFTLEMMKMPSELKEMKVKDFLKAGGDMDAKSVLESNDLCQSVVESIDAKVNAFPSKSKKVLHEITEEGEPENPNGKRTTRRTRKKNSVLTNNASVNMGPPPSTARTRRTTRQRAVVEETPAHGRLRGACGWETPLITPKFDPRLPITPAIGRRPKPGEAMMSLAGSPIINKSSDENVRFTAKTGRKKQTILTVGEKEIDLDDIPTASMDQSTVDTLRLIHAKLTGAIKMNL